MTTKTRMATLLLSLGCATTVVAFPPAPHHTVYGIVRTDQGHPVGVDAKVTMSARGEVIYRGAVRKTLKPGANYELRIPMDAGMQNDLYRPGALSPHTAFTMTVTIGDTNYVPIEVQGQLPTIGEPTKSTRLDLTLGADTDGDGLPDRWEQSLIASSTDDDVTDLTDVTPDGDFDRDGVSNLGEYIAGTYAFDQRDALQLEVVEKLENHMRLRFLAITGRTYSLKTSTDGEAFAPVRFVRDLNQENDQSAFRASEVREIDVFVPTGDAKSQLFQLHVQ